jgi:hypothetical protein
VTTWEEDYVEYLWWDSALMNTVDRGPISTVIDWGHAVVSLFETGSIGDWQQLFKDTAWNAIFWVDPADFTEIEKFANRDDFIHYGDTESIRLCIRATDGLADRPLYGANWTGEGLNTDLKVSVRPRTFQVMALEFRRHGHTFSFKPEDLGWESISHPVVYVSEGKHGQYTSLDECGSFAWSRGWTQGATWQEDCGYEPDERR